MKKATVWYFTGIAILNVALGAHVCRMSRLFVAMHREATEGMALPTLANVLVAVPWWPWCIAAVAIPGIIASFLTKDRNAMLCHFAFGLLVVDVVILAITVEGFLWPFMPHFKLGHDSSQNHARLDARAPRRIARSCPKRAEDTG